MTFYEAAVEVLRRTGRPLHFKKITELAIRDSLLSHVGKTPETTMGERLELEVRREGDSVVVKTRPGVYALREEALTLLNEEAERRAAAKAAIQIERNLGVEVDSEVEDDEEPESVEVEGSDDADEDIEEEPKQALDESAETDDDADDSDEGDENDANEASAGESNGEGGRKRRRRRRRRGKGGAESVERGDGAAVALVPEGDDETAPVAESKAPEANERSERLGRGRKDNSRKDDARKDTGKDTSKDDVTGRFDSVGEAAYAALKASQRSPMTIDAIAEMIFQKKLVRFHTHDPATTVQSAMVTDNQVRQRLGKRPLFVAYGPSMWGLTEWGFSEAGVQKERQVHRLANELRDEVVVQLGKALLDIKPQAIEMMVITLLDRLDYRNLKVSKRSSDGDVFFTADWRRGFFDTRVCVQVVVDAEAEIDVDDVKALRDSLHHNSGEEGVIVHLGEVSKEAVREARNGQKITIIDREALLRLLVQEGIGVRTYNVHVSMVDSAFIEALKE